MRGVTLNSQCSVSSITVESTHKNWTLHLRKCNDPFFDRCEINWSWNLSKFALWYYLCSLSVLWFCTSGEGPNFSCVYSLHAQCLRCRSSGILTSAKGSPVARLGRCQLWVLGELLPVTTHSANSFECEEISYLPQVCLFLANSSSLVSPVLLTFGEGCTNSSHCTACPFCKLYQHPISVKRTTACHI